LLAACSSGSNGPTSDVFSSAPWRDGEVLNYVVRDNDNNNLGRDTLSVEINGATTTVTQLFANSERRDESAVDVNTADFKPLKGHREIVTPAETDVLDWEYTEDGVLIRHNEDRQTGLSVPEHSYDNDTSLFLWRTLPFAEGYEARYTTIITNFRSRQTVELRVTGKESVRVPAGEFTAWRLEIRTNNARQIAWFADTPTRELLKYDNDRNVIFELESR
jgi:hypothetical protein